MKKEGYFGIILIIIAVVISLRNFVLTGAVISTEATPFTNYIGIISISLFLAGALLIFTSRNLEERLSVKNTMIQKRKSGYYLVDTATNTDYSISDIRELASDRELKRELRSKYVSDLLRLYSKSPEKEKYAYQMFIEALSPNTEKNNLNKRLKQFNNAYRRLNDQLQYRNPKRVSEAKEKDFDDEVYVRFEDESKTEWPEEGTIGFLPFKRERMSPARGPLMSAIPRERLIRDGYLLPDGETLNAKMSPQKRKDYLSSNYGIDEGQGQRKMVLFRLERATPTQDFGKYTNIEVKNRVPLVKIIKKK